MQPVIMVVGSFAVGMTLRTPYMPIFGQTLLGTDFDMGPGGKGSNQAVGVARLGCESHLVAVIGDDKLGDIAIELYRAEGVDATAVIRTHERTTGVGFIVLNSAGENFILLDMGANHLLSPQIVDQAETQIAQSRVVMAVLEIPVAAAARGLELAKRHGVTTILNPAPATILPDDVFKYVDYLTPNESELRILLGLSPNDPGSTVDLALRLCQRGVQTVIVTMGERGALIVHGGEITHVAAVAVNVVDSTGAGDAFNAGLAAALAEGKPLIEAVQYGCCAGAMACGKLGVIPSLGRKTEVDQLYQQHFTSQ